MVNLTQAREYGIEVTSCAKSETEKQYKVFDAATGLNIVKCWLSAVEMCKVVNKELSKRIGGFTVNTIERHIEYFGKVIICGIDEVVKLDGHLIMKSGNNRANYNIMGILRRNYEVVSGITRSYPEFVSHLVLLKRVR